jgi:diguanylate cyclase (GGDEF)-like protein
LKYTGRLIAVAILFTAHTLFVTYFTIVFKQMNTIALLGYLLWLCIGYWTGKQYDQAKYYAEKDPLTNLYNRRFVLDSFKKIAALAERTNSKLFVLVIDCDNFKEVNDLYGHHKGDLVLTMIGDTLIHTTRKSDIVARWGGDEFLVIGQYKEDAGLQSVLQRIRENIENISKQLDIPVEVSIGTAIYPDYSRDLFNLIQSADTVMYESKLQRKHCKTINKIASETR